VIATVCENAFGLLKSKPVRIALPDYPLPSSPGLSEHFYPGVDRIVDETLALFGRKATPDLREKRTVPHDVPDMSFTGPF
jgi:pyruvate dehydrogenase E1 component beta subunit